jgi:hypothetical protein
MDGGALEGHKSAKTHQRAGNLARRRSSGQNLDREARSSAREGGVTRIVAYGRVEAAGWPRKTNEARAECGRVEGTKGEMKPTLVFDRTPLVPSIQMYSAMMEPF